MSHLSWLPFIATSLLIIVTPGQDMVLVMSRTLSGGTRAGLVTAAGVSVGCSFIRCSRRSVWARFFRHPNGCSRR